MTFEAKAFIAAFDPKHAWVIFGSDRINDDVVHVSFATEDIGLPDPPSDGLWMWEGIVHVDVDGDAVYRGTYRRPTDIEAIAASCGENPLSPPCGT